MGMTSQIDNQQIQAENWFRELRNQMVGSIQTFLDRSNNFWIDPKDLGSVQNVRIDPKNMFSAEIGIGRRH